MLHDFQISKISDWQLASSQLAIHQGIYVC